MMKSDVRLRLDDLLTDSQLSKKTGWDRSTLWRYRNRKRRPLPYYKIGGKPYYDPKQVDRWIEGCAVVKAS